MRHRWELYDFSLSAQLQRSNAYCPQAATAASTMSLFSGSTDNLFFVGPHEYESLHRVQK